MVERIVAIIIKKDFNLARRIIKENFIKKNCLLG